MRRCAGLSSSIFGEFLKTVVKEFALAEAGGKLNQGRLYRFVGCSQLWTIFYTHKMALKHPRSIPSRSLILVRGSARPSQVGVIAAFPSDSTAVVRLANQLGDRRSLLDRAETDQMVR